jgi:hypothetical protein
MGAVRTSERPARRNPFAPGKRTLTEQLVPHALVQRSPAQAAPGHQDAHGGDRAPRIAPPEAGIDKPGFIDNSKGAPLYGAPAEAGGALVRDAPLPPATRVFASGTHPRLKHWWYVTAFVDQTMLRGYVEDFRVNVDLPEPMAELRQLNGNETPRGWPRRSSAARCRTATTSATTRTSSCT